jgi:HAD superfamily, subfamily IIIB (Acid phosphatase)
MTPREKAIEAAAKAEKKYSASRQGDAIEVTPAMIEAGADQLAGFNPDLDYVSDVVISIYQAMEMVFRSNTRETMDCYIFDIDGTIADNSHRQHFLRSTPKDWKSYNAAMHLDKPMNHVIEIARRLNSTGGQIVLCTGREIVFEDVTREWLSENDVFYRWLFMRREKDYRSDVEVKQEMLSGLRSGGFNPIMAFDDRNSVVAMWRANGIPCAQVAEGDF